MDEKSEHPLGQPPPENIGDIIRQKRKHRPQRACIPCRLRKVKCSYTLPCETCAQRDHPELCSYDEAAKRLNSGASLARTQSSAAESPLDSGTWAPSKIEWTRMNNMLNAITTSLHQVQGDVHSLLKSRRSKAPGSSNAPTRSPDRSGSELPDEVEYDIHGLQASNVLTGEDVYLGSKSVPAMVIALSQDNGNSDAVQELLSKSVLPIFALDNESATYPFVDLWGVPHGSIRRLELLCSLLPSDADCHQIFRQYRDTAYVIYPVIVDILHFEGGLIEFLTQRRDGLNFKPDAGLTNQLVFGKSINWLGLLFAVLASGLQCSNLPRKERLAKSQVYVCCAYECLRIINYMSHATLVDVQSLLIIGNVLSNNMNAGVAWTLLGITSRIAQSLGLHYEIPPNPTPSQAAKASIWWQIIWQDSLLSITFDRYSSNISASHLDDQIDRQLSDYVRAMRQLCKIGLEIVQERAAARKYQQRLLRISEFRNQIDSVSENLVEHLTVFTKCKSMKDQLEYWNFHLHRSYIVSELCRPTIRRKSDSHRLTKDQKDLERSLRSTCVVALANTVEAFLGLHNVTKFATQSWAAVHRSLSSALLLGILGIPGKDERVRALLLKLSTVMHEVQSDVDHLEKSAPITRSLEALAKLIPQDPANEASLMSNSPPFFDFDASDLYSPAGGPGSVGSTTSQVHTSPFQSSESERSSPLSLLNSIIWGSHPGSSTAWNDDAISWL